MNRAVVRDAVNGGLHFMVVEMNGLPWPRTEDELTATVPELLLLLKRLPRWESNFPIPIVRVHMDGPGTSLGPLRPVFPEWGGREVEVALSQPPGAAGRQFFRITGTAAWRPVGEILEGLRSRLPDVDEMELDLRDGFPYLEDQGDGMVPGTTVTWRNLTPDRPPFAAKIEATLGAVARVADVLRAESLGALEAAVSNVDDETAQRWTTAEGIAERGMYSVPGLVALARDLVAIRASYGRPILREPETERLEAALLRRAPRRDFPRRWAATRDWAERSGDPDVVAYAGLLGVATSFVQPDPFLDGFADGIGRARAHGVLVALDRAWEVMLAHEGSERAARARWRVALGPED